MSSFIPQDDQPSHVSIANFNKDNIKCLQLRRDYGYRKEVLRAVGYTTKELYHAGFSALQLLPELSQVCIEHTFFPAQHCNYRNIYVHVAIDHANGYHVHFDDQKTSMHTSYDYIK